MISLIKIYQINPPCSKKVDLDGKVVESIMLFKNNEAFESYWESMYEHYDEGSIIGEEADISIGTE